MPLDAGHWSGETVVQAGLFLVVSTLALTASFLGAVALVTGSVVGLTDRLPFYALAMAIAFVAAIMVFESEFRSGTLVLRVAGLAAAATLVLVTLGGEGVAFTVQRPGTVLSSQLLVYFLAAGLIGTGLGYWGVHHWQEVARKTGL
jgi:hypothetical protein